MCALVDQVERWWQVSGPLYDYICVPSSSAKWALARCIQSKSGWLRQKMITFDYIAPVSLRKGEGMLLDGKGDELCHANPHIRKLRNVDCGMRNEQSHI